MTITRKKLISDSAFIYIGNLLIRLKGIIFLPIIISYAGIANYGAFVQITINAAVIGPLCTLELGMAFLRYTSKYHDTQIKELRRDYWTVLTTGFILSLFGASIIYLFSPLVSEHILAGSSQNSLRLSSLLVINTVLSSISLRFMECRKRFKSSSIYQIFYNLLPYFGFVAGIILRSEIFFGLLLYIMIQSSLVLLLQVYIIRQLSFSLPSITTLKAFLKYSWALTVSGFSTGLRSKVDRYFIGYFLGPASIGIYNVVYSVCAVLYTFDVPFNRYFSTYLPKSWDEGRRDEVKKHLTQGSVYYLVISLGVLVFMVFLIRPVLNLILNRDLFEDISNSELLVLFTGLAMIGHALTCFFEHFIKYREQNHIILLFRLMTAGLNIVFNLLLVRFYGVLGASIAAFASSTIIILSYYCYLNRTFDSILLYKVARIGLSAFAVAVLFFLRAADSFLNITINVILGLAIYTFFILVLRVVELNQITRGLHD